MISKKLLVIVFLCLIGGEAIAMKRGGTDDVYSRLTKIPKITHSEDISLCHLFEKKQLNELLSAITGGKSNVNELDTKNKPLLIKVFDEIDRIKLKCDFNHGSEDAKQLYAIASAIIDNKQLDGTICDQSLRDGVSGTLLHGCAYFVNSTVFRSKNLEPNQNVKAIFLRLLLKCEKAINMKDSLGCTPLHILTQDKGLFYTPNPTALHCADQLLQCGGDPNVKNAKGETPLYNSRSKEMILLLAAFGASAEVTNNDGKRPEECAKNEVRSLLNQKVFKENIGTAGEYALPYVASATGKRSVFEYISDRSMYGTKPYYNLNEARLMGVLAMSELMPPEDDSDRATETQSEDDATECVVM